MTTSLRNAGYQKLAADQQREVNAWLADFSGAWRDDLLDEHVRKLPPIGSPIRLPVLIEMIKIDLAKQWEHDRRPTVEDYCRLYPEIGLPAEAPADLLLVEFVVRRRFDDGGELKTFADRFPKQVKELSSLVAECRSYLLAHYRAGDLKTAYEWVGPKSDAITIGWSAQANNYLIRAMIHHRWGQTQKARGWLKRARRFSVRYVHPHEPLAYEILLREASAMIEGKTKSQKK